MVFFFVYVEVSCCYMEQLTGLHHSNIIQFIDLVTGLMKILPFNAKTEKCKKIDDLNSLNHSKICPSVYYLGLMICN